MASRNIFLCQNKQNKISALKIIPTAPPYLELLHLDNKGQSEHSRVLYQTIKNRRQIKKKKKKKILSTNSLW